eukprot:767371-Prorocentrum_minimum.AAC.5
MRKWEITTNVTHVGCSRALTAVSTVAASQSGPSVSTCCTVIPAVTSPSRASRAVAQQAAPPSSASAPPPEGHGASDALPARDTP